MVILYVVQLLNNKIYNISELEKNTNIPIIGSISKGSQTERKLLDKNDRTSIAESFRLLVSNLDFIVNTNKKAKTILFTSTISGEGKSFISANLASFLAHSGNKVVLVGMDLRAPKLDEFFEQTKPFGITHFIKDKEMTIDQIICHSKTTENLDVVFSGVIVPNFLEMTKSDRLQALFDALNEKYDYVIVDSAPVGLASDTLFFAGFMDMCLYVVRANYLDKRLLDVSGRLKKENRFKNMMMILNDVDMEKAKYGYGYGYAYGYGYGQYQDEKKKSKKKGFSKLFNK
jgi:capsular exopolysaccharide synthesis family protein